MSYGPYESTLRDRLSKLVKMIFSFESIDPSERIDSSEQVLVDILKFNKIINIKLIRSSSFS